MNSPIATLELVEVTASGSRIPMRVEIGQPHPDDRGGWACSVAVEGYDCYTKDIFGEDSMQALCLGLQMVRLHLELALARDSRLVDPVEDTEFPFRAYFQKVLDEKSSA
jgi:hypothetical protein